VYYCSVNVKFVRFTEGGVFKFEFEFHFFFHNYLFKKKFESIRVRVWGNIYLLFKIFPVETWIFFEFARFSSFFRVRVFFFQKIIKFRVRVCPNNYLFD